MYFKESTNPSRILTNDYREKFYLRDQRVKPLKKRDLPTNESRTSSPSSIYGNNVTLEDSIEKSLEPLKQYKQDSVIERGYHPHNHVHIQAEGKLKCGCTICTAQNTMKNEPEDAFTDPFFVNLQNGLNDHVISLERGFVFVLKRLMPPRHLSHGLAIRVPETLVFIDGEPKFFALTGKDKTLKFMNQREKLAMHEIRKFFNDRFAMKDEEQRVSESRNTLESRNVILTTNEIATERTQGIDLRKGTPSLQLGIAKSARHKTTKSLKMKVAPANREVALLKFNDDSTTILCETEFENLITKKKFDPYWRNIAFIQNYRGFSKYIHTLQRAYFIYDREKNNPLFSRAAIEVYQLIREIPTHSDSYIPAFEEENFQKNLRNHSESDYCLYLIMKVFHFIEIVYGFRILKMCGEFVKDTNDALWLTNVTHLQYHKTKGFDENHGKVRSMFNLDTEERSTTHESSHEIRRKDDANVLSELMQKQYDNLKRGVGIKEPVPSYQEDISDNVFTQLYPNAPYRLSLLLKANSKPNHVNNSKNVVSDTSFRVSSTRRTLEDERQPSGPIKGVYLGMTKNVPSQNVLTSNNTSGNGNQSNRSSIIKSRMTKLKGESHENLSKAGRTPMPSMPSMPSLPSLGNIDGYTNVSVAMEPKKKVQKSDNGRSTTGRSNSQPNMKKTFKFYGLNPGVVNQYPKIPNDMFKGAVHSRILQRTPSEIISQAPKITKLTTVEGDVYTERCTPIADRSRNSNPNTPYTKGLRGLSREVQGKLAVQLDQGPNSRRSQSVNKKALGYILNN